MATALMSLMSGRPVRGDVAMTGEVTLTGQVLPIGGLKEKALAAQRAGIAEVIAPQRNEPELEDFPPHLRDAMRFTWVADVPEVFAAALEGAGGARPAPRRRARPAGAAPAGAGRRRSAERGLVRGGPPRGYARARDASGTMRGGMAAKKKAAKAGAAAVAVKRSPYVQRAGRGRGAAPEPLAGVRVGARRGRPAAERQVDRPTRSSTTSGCRRTSRPRRSRSATRRWRCARRPSGRRAAAASAS